MLDIGITRMSTKGQIVIPNDLRQEFNTGDKLLIIGMSYQIVLKQCPIHLLILENNLYFI